MKTAIITAAALFAFLAHSQPVARTADAIVNPHIEGF
jgi:hypothetical protein